MRYRLAAITAMEFILGLTLLTWAGEWIQGENRRWVYKENEEPLKGRNQINGIRYCLDTETDIQIEKLSMTAEAACRPLENKLVGMEVHQDKEEPLQFKVDYENSKMIQVSVGYEEKPDVLHRINTYETNKKEGTADPVVGGKKLPLR